MNKTILILGLLGTASIGLAAPHAKKPDDNFSITMSAGKGRLGLQVLSISPELRAFFGAPDDRGVLVDGVRPDSPAAKAGIHVGDVILEVDGDAATSGMDMLDAMSDHKKGESVPISVIRDHKRTELSAKLEDDPGARIDQRAFGQLEPRDMFRGFDDRDIRRQLDEIQRRLDKLEKR